MKRLMQCCVLCAALALMAGTAMAHTPLCNCFDNGDDTVTCEGGFSDGSSAAGVEMSVLDSSGKPILSGKMNEDSEYTFDKPSGKYSVRFFAGEGHEVMVSSDNIVE